MKSRRRLSLKQFEKRNPSLYVASVSDEYVPHLPGMKPKNPGFKTTVVARKHGSVEDYAVGTGRSLDEALWDLAQRCYKLASLDAMDRQGWKDANTGQTGVPLQSHHIKKRSKGRLDATENLAGVSADIHGFQHERRNVQKCTKEEDS